MTIKPPLQRRDRPRRTQPEYDEPTNFPTIGPHHIRAFRVGQGIPNLTALSSELQDMTDVLLGRTDPPISGKRIDCLMEVAGAFYARACEINIQLLEGERVGTVIKGGGHYRFRTGELRTFIEMSKNSFELGSRRVTVARMEQEEDSYQ